MGSDAGRINAMAAAKHTKSASDEVRENLARSRALRDEMIRSGNAVVYHLRRAAQLRREAARNNGR
jgi:hypothetical protein